MIDCLTCEYWDSDEGCPFCDGCQYQQSIECQYVVSDECPCCESCAIPELSRIQSARS